MGFECRPLSSKRMLYFKKISNKVTLNKIQTLQKTMNMERKDIFEKLTKIFIEIMDNENIILEDRTTANDIDEWDSLAHIQLVVAIEKEFNIKFTSKEILSWNNVGEIVNCISKK